MRDARTAGLVYAFSEANHAVFQNAGIWKLKRDLDIQTWVYAPREYAGLYWSAEKILVISPAPYEFSGEIQRFSLNPISRFSPKSWFTSGGYHFIKREILKRLPAHLFHALPLSFRHDYKSKRYLFESGVYDFCRTHFEKNSLSGKFIGTSMYTDPSNFSKFRMDLTRHFQISFENLREQIESGVFADFRLDRVALTQSEKLSVEKILEFVNYREKAVFLRTRNIDNQVNFQNANPLELKPLIEFLLNCGVCIVNSGIPPVRLGIEHENYLELSHDLPVETELAIAQKFPLVMQSAWAGLFTAVSTLNTSLITFDEEWSTKNLPTPISLMGARRSAGKKDLILGKRLSQKRPVELIGSEIMSLFENK